MVDVAQLVRASDCGSEGRGFEPPRAPQRLKRGDPVDRPLFFMPDQTDRLIGRNLDQAISRNTILKGGHQRLISRFIA